MGERNRLTVSQTRASARALLAEELEALTFARVASVTIPASIRNGAIYYRGTATEEFVGMGRGGPSRAPREFFFDSNCRSGRSGLVVGGAALDDPTPDPAALGSVPHHGQMIVGYVVPSRRPNARTAFEFSQWLPDAQPIAELRRIVRHGTRMQAKQIRATLQWPAPSTQDELWALERLVLHSDLELFQIRDCVENGESIEALAEEFPVDRVVVAKSLALHCKAHLFVKSVCIRLRDNELLEKWESQRKTLAFASAFPVPPGALAQSALSISVPKPAPVTVYAPVSPPYNPSSPVPYSPTSPVYNPSSPAYAPASPAYSPLGPAEPAAEQSEDAEIVPSSPTVFERFAKRVKIGE